jgi:putative polyhydroxyalkanoate system protein
MATIDIRRSHTLDKEEAKRRAETLVQSMADRLGVLWRWDGDLIRFDAPSGVAKGSNGTIRVDPNAVRVEIDLPFLLRALKGKLESKINEKLDELIRA